MSSRRRTKGRRTKGQFMAVSGSLLNHENFKGLSKGAKLIFFYLYSQYNGFNNGNLQATLKTVKQFGYGRSSTNLWKSLEELEDKRFIVKTRQGGKNQCNLFALTTESIDECKGIHDYPISNVASNDWKRPFKN